MIPRLYFLLILSLHALPVEGRYLVVVAVNSLKELLAVEQRLIGEHI
jgi:hypothetical protein